MSHLKIDSLDWALDFVHSQGSNNLFQAPFETEVVRRQWPDLRSRLAEIRVDEYRFGEPRKLLYPKDQLSFRWATQLDPLDDIVFSSLILDIGSSIESLRVPIDKQTVWSARFDPAAGRLYHADSGWQQHWERSQESGKASEIIATTDIADFYNQISHVDILRGLDTCGIEASYRRAVESFLARAAPSRRGLPIGPHGAHLLAELVLAPIDNILLTEGYRFSRFIDDYNFFCQDASEAQLSFFELARHLEHELKLSLNRSKTSVRNRADFLEAANLRLREKSVTAQEKELVEIIKEVTDGDYDFASFEEAEEIDPEVFTEEVITSILSFYLESDFIDYPKIGWLFRRLTQIRAPGGLRFAIENFEKLLPVVGDAAGYLAAAGGNYDGGWVDLGERILEFLDLPITRRSDYLQLSLLGLYAQRAELNHFQALARRFPNARPTARREILLAAGRAGASEWLWAQRRDAKRFDTWLQRAFVYATNTLPPNQQDECLRFLSAEGGRPEQLLVAALLKERDLENKEQQPKDATVAAGDGEETPHPWVVISLHGIKTTGRWQDDLAIALESTSAIYRRLNYGYFLGLPSSSAREKKVEWFMAKYEDLRREFGDARFCLVAHSFGTYMSAMAMRERQEIRFDRVIYCGSIVPRDLDWSTLILKRRQVGRLLNECGRRDFWSGIVAFFVSDAGPSGVEGFEDTANGLVINDVRHQFRHSDFFYGSNYEKRWIPFLQGADLQKLIPPKELAVNWSFRLFWGFLLIVALILVFAC